MTLNSMKYFFDNLIRWKLSMDTFNFSFVTGSKVYSGESGSLTWTRLTNMTYPNLDIIIKFSFGEWLNYWVKRFKLDPNGHRNVVRRKAWQTNPSVSSSTYYLLQVNSSRPQLSSVQCTKKAAKSIKSHALLLVCKYNIYIYSSKCLPHATNFTRKCIVAIRFDENRYRIYVIKPIACETTDPFWVHGKTQ